MPLLTVANHEMLRSKQPTSDLPLTFRNAIQLAGRLNLKYIWIDCLCIIQDSEGGVDWMRESRTMQYVYANAGCNFVAGDCGDMDQRQGIFRERQPASVGCYVVKCKWWSEPRTARVFLITTVKDDIDKSPIYERGWVLQERLLASRILHFAKHQVYWSCTRLSASESMPGGYSEDISRGLSLQLMRKYARDVSSWRNLERPTNNMPSELLRLWMDIVEVYSNCKFTFNDDRLVALGGIIQMFETLHSDRYFAGNWRPSILQCLCWHVDRFKMADSIRIPDLPSWSWTSVLSVVEYTWLSRGDEDWSNAVELATIQVLERPDSQSVEDAASVLSIEACPISAQCRPGPVQADGYEVMLVVSPIEHQSWLPTDTGTIQCMFDVDPRATEVFDVVLVPLTAHCIGPSRYAFLTAEGLILQRAGSDSDLFNRIGYFEHTTSPEFGDEYAAFLHMICDEQGNLRFNSSGHLMVADDRPLQTIGVV